MSPQGSCILQVHPHHLGRSWNGYKGQAGNIQGTLVLTTALQVHSVEARHAAEVRRVRGMFGWDGAFNQPLTKAEVLAAAAPFIVG